MLVVATVAVFFDSGHGLCWVHVLWKLQVDLIRPWRQLLEKVEGTVRTLVRDSLLVSADDAEVVLRAWSHFLLTCKPKCLGEGGKGVTMEIVSKLEAVLLFMQRLNNKINSYSKAGMCVWVCVSDTYHCPYSVHPQVIYL